MYSVLVAQTQHSHLHDHHTPVATLPKARALVGKVRAILAVLGHH